ncbi:MAG TPA: sigma-70 family RNA polymerase sigma factor [Acidobacteriaceae bacterium]|jgi:RNA polymerase sigma-70 factor (ECF subfamily)
MNESHLLASQFEQNRSHLRAVAYRMLGSLSEADDAVQEAWLKLSRYDAGSIDNLGGWLTTVVARVCLDMLRSRNARREEPLLDHSGADHSDGPPPAAKSRALDPEQETLLAESVGLALLVVLNKLDPAERIAFVLHDLFAVPFEEIAAIVGRSPAAARQLASRARRRVQGADTAAAADLASRRKVIDAFLAALRAADFHALVAVLDPDVVITADAVAQPVEVMRQIRGAENWAQGAITAARGARAAHPALIDGTLGLVIAPKGRLFRVLRFTLADEKIAAIEVIGDPDRLRQLELGVLAP